MKLRLFLSIIMCSFIFTNLAFSQEDDSTACDHKSWEEWVKDLDVMHGVSGKPTISLSFGISNISLKNSTFNFADANMAELKIGYTRERSKYDSINVFNYDYRYFALAYAASDLFKTYTPDFSEGSVYPDMQSKMWRAGFMNADGYGYRIGRGGLVLYNSSGLVWSRVDVIPGPEILSAVNVPASPYPDYRNFDESIRFGTSAEGGIRFETGGVVNFEAAYERSVIFPRHLFWKWAGSLIIEGFSQSLVNKFTDEVFDSSPQLAPVVSFVLKNALSYGIYELRQDKMNWPFESAPPLSYDQFKFGVTFVF